MTVCAEKALGKHRMLTWNVLIQMFERPCPCGFQLKVAMKLKVVCLREDSPTEETGNNNAVPAAEAAADPAAAVTEAKAESGPAATPPTAKKAGRAGKADKP